MQTTGTLWRDTARPVRFGFLDARAASGFAVWVLHMCWTTFWLSIAVMVLFFIFDRYGVTPPAAWRLFKQGFFSEHRSVRSGYCIRRASRW